jgi:hypothetical protein
VHLEPQGAFAFPDTIPPASLVLVAAFVCVGAKAMILVIHPGTCADGSFLINAGQGCLIQLMSAQSCNACFLPDPAQVNCCAVSATLTALSGA